MLCDIEGRGWCIPSGRVEPYETSLEAVHREAVEEGGVLLRDVDYLGCYHISERREVRWADCYSARIKAFVDITIPEESKGRRLATLEELPEIYHLWTPLTQMVFELSHEVVERRRRLI